MVLMKLYQLYNTDGSNNDLEETTDVISTMPVCN